MGEGAVAKAVVENGTISQVMMINQGDGYDAMNYPDASVGFVVNPDDDGVDGTLNAIANKEYIRDLYLGTGEREEEGGYTP